MTKALKIDLATLPKVRPTRLVTRLVALISKGAAESAGACAETARSRSDQAAVAAIRAELVKRFNEIERNALRDRLAVANCIAFLSPQDPVWTVLVVKLARQEGGGHHYECALTRLARRFPDDAGLSNIRKKLREDMALAAGLEPERRDAVIERAGLRLAAACDLTPELFLPLFDCMRRRHAKHSRWARLVQHCPAFREDPAVREMVSVWLEHALQLSPDASVRELMPLLAVAPPDRVVPHLLALTVSSGRVPSSPLINALTAVRSSLDSDLVAQADRKWHAKMRRYREAGQDVQSMACFRALEALGCVNLQDLMVPITHLDDEGDLEEELPKYLRQWVRGGGEPAFLAPYKAKWKRDLQDCEHHRDFESAWPLGRRVAVAAPDDEAAVNTLVAMSAFYDAPAEELLEIVAELARMDVPAVPAPTSRTARALAAAAAIALDAGRTWSGLSVLCWAAHHHGLFARELDDAVGLHGREVAPDFDVTLDLLSSQWPAVASYLKGLRLLICGEHWQALASLDSAMDLGLPPSLETQAEQEINAGTYHLVSEENFPGEPAIVLVEVRAAESAIKHCMNFAPSIILCRASFDSAGTGELNDMGEIEFRYVDMPDVSEAADALTLWAIDALQREAKLQNMALPLSKRLLEHVRRYLFRRMFNRTRVSYNFLKAVEASGVRRAFFLVNQGDASRVAIRTLLERGGFEVRVACGAPTLSVRRRFNAAHVSSPFALDPALSRASEVGIATLALSPAPRRLASLPVRAGIPDDSDERPRCFLVVASHRPDIVGALPDLVEGLAQKWRPVILFMDNDKNAALVREHFIRDPRPNVYGAPFHTITVPELWAEAEQTFSNPPLEQFVRSINPEGSHFQRGPLIVSSDIVPVFDGFHRATATATAVDGWAGLFARRAKASFALFVHSASLEPNVICSALEARGIPTMWLQMLQHPRDTKFMRPPARHHLLLDHYSAELWQNFLGVSAKDMTVVGSLRMSTALKNVRNLSREDARLEFGVQLDQQLVVVATQPVAAVENVCLIENVSKALRDQGHVFILVKMHPTETDERVETYERVLSEPNFSGRFSVSRSVDIYRAIKAADLVVTQYSNVGIEAMMLNCPTLSIIVGEQNTTFSLGAHGIEEVIAGEDAVARIRTLLLDASARAAAAALQRQILDASPEQYDGQTVGRIVDAIDSVLQKASTEQ